ncbi:nuclear transport factor 2 family protein [Fibrella aquatilis]|uniref:Nuclear transport factor 2 family protein n=1 Tax=Fibrella aquatilis TaxID=2817059 RepID=A0A939G4J0_9BACT|nr:nuclear transport factor 2 family protein [Fibrella aquatilis]MBO0931969.1 nuclear transport factor 2 family protein [Fibrella aquatilis]
MTTPTNPPINEQWGYDFFRMVDRMDPDEYVIYFQPDGRVIFSNDPPIVGTEAIRQAMQQFYATIDSMHHEIVHLWAESNTVISRAEAQYVRKADGKAVNLPAVTIIDLVGDKVQQVQFYMDMTPLKQ